MTPEFSPAMMKFFLRARVAHAANVAFPASRGSQERGAKTEIRKRAGVTVQEFEMAWMGRLLSPEPRLRLWIALGIDPSVYRIQLTHGGQEVIP